MVADIQPARIQAKKVKIRNTEWKAVDKQKRSADSGVFSRSISERNDDSITLTDCIDSRLGSIEVNDKDEMDCDTLQKVTINGGNCNGSTSDYNSKTNNNNNNNRSLTKKSSKDSGIDCRTKSDSISSDAAKELLQSTQYLATENVDDDEDEQFSSLPDHIYKSTNHHANPTTDSSEFSSSNKNQQVTAAKIVPAVNILKYQQYDEPKLLLLDNNNSGKNIEPTDAPLDATVADQLDDFFIDPKLINRTDGLKRSYFMTDENGSPKILEEIIEREIERKNKRKEMTNNSSDPDLFGCLGFSKLSRLFKSTRKSMKI